jgi:hypothetical protein
MELGNSTDFMARQRMTAFASDEKRHSGFTTIQGGSSAKKVSDPLVLESGVGETMKEIAYKIADCEKDLTSLVDS